VTVDGLKSAEVLDSLARPTRSRWHLLGIAAGFLGAVLPIAFAWKHNLSAERITICVAFCSWLFFAGARSWRRWFYPDRLPVRWTEDSAQYRWVKRLEWIAGGLNLVVTVWLVISLGDNAHHGLWMAFAATVNVRAILTQYREDRKPLTVALPSISPYDPSLRLTNPIRPVYSEDWDNY
jgi:hypothetical protein